VTGESALVDSHRGHKSRGFHSKSYGEFADVCQGHVLLAAFDSTRVGAVNAGRVREGFLAQASSESMLAQSAAKLDLPSKSLRAAASTRRRVRRTAAGHRPER